MHRRMDRTLRTTSVGKFPIARLLHNWTHASDAAKGSRFSFGPARMESHRSRHVLDGVTGRNFEQRTIGLGTLALLARHPDPLGTAEPIKVPRAWVRAMIARSLVTVWSNRAVAREGARFRAAVAVSR